MYVAATDTIGAIVGTNLERGLRPPLFFFFLLNFLVCLDGHGQIARMLKFQDHLREDAGTVRDIRN